MLEEYAASLPSLRVKNYVRADKTLHSVRGLTQEDARRVVVAIRYENTPYPVTTDLVTTDLVTGLYEK